MANLPQPQVPRRPTRVRFSETTPAVLRFKDGRRIPGSLQVISMTGGLLLLSKPLDQGSEVKLLFLTQWGPVLGSAELLNPVSETLQPFRFLTLYNDDEARLQTAIQESSQKVKSDDDHPIERFRAW